MISLKLMIAMMKYNQRAHLNYTHQMLDVYRHELKLMIHEKQNKQSRCLQVITRMTGISIHHLDQWWNSKQFFLLLSKDLESMKLISE